MTKMRLGGLASAILLLAGCGGGTPAIPESRAPAPTAETSSDITWKDIAGSSGGRKPAAPPVCGDNPVAIGFSEISNSIKWRSIEISVKNCSDESLTIEAPDVSGVDHSGNESQLTDHLRGEGDVMEGLLDPPVDVEPGEDSRVFMLWRSDATCEDGLREIVVSSMGVEARREDCFELSTLEGNDENQLTHHWGNRKSK